MTKKHILLFTLLTTPLLHANRHTNKTFLCSRPQGYYMPLELSTWHRQLWSSDTNRFGASLQAVGYYRFSTNENGLGRYFGADDSNCLTFGLDSGKNNVDSRAIIHRAVPLEDTENATDLAGKITLNPEQTVWGITFTYHQELDFFTNGLFLRIRVPVASMRNCLDLKCATTACGEESRCDSDDCDVNRCSAKDTTLNKTILDYFKGSITQPAGPNEQAALTRAKICGSQTETGVADVDVMLGICAAEHSFYRTNFNLFLTIPTDEKKIGTYLFEPMLGNCGHWSVGAGFESTFNIYQGRNSAFEASCALTYRYFFGSRRIRTLGFKLDNKTTVQWSHYLLGAQIGQKGVFPLANVLTREVSVSPGSSVEGMINFAMHSGTGTFNFGYNFYARDCERVNIPGFRRGCNLPQPCGNNDCCSATSSWPENTYGFANFTYNALDDFAIGFGTTPPNDTNTMNNPFSNRAITADQLDTNTCATPASLTHMIYLALGWTFNEKHLPIMLGVGSAFEFVNSNAGVEGATVWGKIALTF